MTHSAPRLTPGFSRPVLDSQQAFRRLLRAMSRPGEIVRLGGVAEPPEPLHPAAAALCLTMADMDTPVWLDAGHNGPAASWLRFHCGCPMADDPGKAAFALITDPANSPALEDFSPGDSRYPDRSATLAVQIEALGRGEALRLSGPGIEEEREFLCQGLPDHFLKQRERLFPLFPLGIDIFLVAGSRVAGLPRTTRIEVQARNEVQECTLR